MADPLYGELISIGRRERTLRPDRLEGYKQLLASPEVRRRAGNSSDPSILAQHASDAIHDAITSLVDPQDKQVATAALCSTSEYEGLTIKVREHKMPGVSSSVFKYHRLKAFAAIIEYLIRSSDGKDRADQVVARLRRRCYDPGSNNSQLTGMAIDFARNAVELHYASLAALFAQDIRELLAHEGILQLIEPPSYVDPFVNYILERYIKLLHRSWYEVLGKYLESLPSVPRVGSLVISLFESIRDATPAGSSDTPDAYKQWRQWYRKNCGVASSSRESGLLPLVAASGAIQSRLLSHFSLDGSPIHEQARLIAYKTLSHYFFRVEELEPLAGKLSLRQRAEAYFDIQSPLLTERGIKCYRNLNQV